jgi:dynein heavy chain
MEDLSQLKKEFIDRIKLIANRAILFKDSLFSYAYLWKEDRRERMRQFLVYNHFLSDWEQDKISESHLAVPEFAPNLDHFKDKVEEFKKKSKSHLDLTFISDLYIFTLKKGK